MVPASPTELAKSLAEHWQAKTATGLMAELDKLGLIDASDPDNSFSRRTADRYLKAWGSSRARRRRHSHQRPLFVAWMKVLTPIPNDLQGIYCDFLLAPDESAERRARAAEVVLAAQRSVLMAAPRALAGIRFVLGHALLHIGSELSDAVCGVERIVSAALRNVGLVLTGGTALTKDNVLRRAEEEFVLSKELALTHFPQFGFDVRSRLGELSAKVQRGKYTEDELRSGLVDARCLVAANPGEVRALVTALYVTAVLKDEEAAVEFGRLLAAAGFTDLSSVLPNGRAIMAGATEQDRWLRDVFKRREMLTGNRLTFLGVARHAALIVALPLIMAFASPPKAVAGPIIPLATHGQYEQQPLDISTAC